MTVLSGQVSLYSDSIELIMKKGLLISWSLKQEGCFIYIRWVQFLGYSCLSSSTPWFTRMFLGMAFGTIPSNNGTGYKLKRLQINMALRRPSAPPPPQPAPRRGPFLHPRQKLVTAGISASILQNGAFMNGVASYPRVVNGYNELRRRGTAPVTQIDLCSGGQQASWYMGTPPKSPPGVMR
ncbi:hypothetical protein NC652_030947 [Populus alba x Populus x berolinensis]|nr:hypothetical protein NC652_030947 [Populus alba x Populus x berolinensis]